MAVAAASTFRLFGFECAVVPFDMGVEAEALGCQVNYYASHTDILYPTISKKLAEKVEELDIQLPSDLATAGRVPIVTEAIRLLKEEVGDQVAVGAWILGPFTLAGQIIELDDLIKKTLKTPEAVSNVLRTLEEPLISLANIYNSDHSALPHLGFVQRFPCSIDD